MKHKEIVFLDLDGVVFPFGSYLFDDVYAVFKSPFDYIDDLLKATDKRAVKDLQDFTEGKSIVLISTWRNMFDEVFLLTLMSRIGLPLDGIATSKSLRIASKERDISEYLYELEYIGTWYLVDDEDHMPQHIAGGIHIQPDPDIGFRTSLISQVEDE